MACVERTEESNPSTSQESSTYRPPRPPPPQLQSDVNSFEYLKKLHDRSYHFSNQGLSAEENENPRLALSSYKQGLDVMNKALAINCEELKNASGDKIDQAKLLQQKMTKSKMQIEYRIQELERELAPQPSQESLMTLDSPPSYDEAMYLEDSIMDSESISSNTDSLLANADQIFMINEGVQIFYITPEGYVSAPSYPATLRICKFTEESAMLATNAAPPPPAFLQAGNWIYPLIPDTSPALQTSYGAYIFPDATSSSPGSSVGVLLPETVSPEERQSFEQILASLTMMREQEVVQQPVVPSAPPQEVVTPEDTRQPQPAASHVQPRATEAGEKPADAKEDTSTKISKGIITAAEWITWGLEKGAEKTNELIKKGSQRLQKTLSPTENPKHIDPKVQKGVTYARKVTHVAVSVSAFVVTKLGAATVALGKQIAPHMKKQGEKILPKSLTKTDTQGKSKMGGVFEVAASGVQGFGTVYMGLEASAKSLAKNLANETVVVVKHKYGAEAGNITDNALYTVGNFALTAYNVDNLGIKAVAKRAAKDTGKAVLIKYIEEHKANTNQAIGTNTNSAISTSIATNGQNTVQPSTNVYPQLPENKM